jgi:hypothetical protein
MLEIERSNELSDSLNTILDSFSTDFDSNPSEYCTSRIHSGSKELNCFVDLDKFSSAYKSVCRDLEAEHLPINLFMQCIRSDTVLEMELVNIPTCIAHECDMVETGIAVDRLLLESNEQGSSNGLLSGYSCTFYTRTKQLQEVSSANINKFMGMASLAVIGVINFVVLAL